MASTVNANWGGVQLLDTVEILNSVVNKGADYFDSIGIESYDFLYIEAKAYTISDNILREMANGLYSKEFVNNHIMMKEMSTSDQFTRLTIYYQNGWIFAPYSSQNYKQIYYIYGIKL